MKKSAKSKQIVCSPRPHMITKSISRACPLQSQFAWYEDDIWTAIAQFLDAKSLVSLALANRHFYNMVMDDSIWKLICLRDLEVPPPREPVQFCWKDLYTSAFDGRHSYSIRQVEKHIDWMRIGAFSFDSSEVLVTEKLSEAKASFSIKEKGKFRVPTQACLLSDVKTGIWIADLQLVRCPVCNLKTCEGTMQTLDVRHFELFLHKEYKDGSWDYVEVGSHTVHCNCLAATAGIFDGMHIKSDSTLELVDLKSWMGKPGDWEPKVKISSHATAVSTNLQDNEGLHVTYHVLKAGEKGPVVAIRVSQQLI